MKPSRYCNMPEILGNGYGFLLITFFTSLRSAKDRKDLSGFEIVNKGHTHLELLIFLSTPYEHSGFSSSFNCFKSRGSRARQHEGPN
jgi:hypothetical protein